MPSQNDSFITTLKKAHLEWGTYRHTDSRDMIYGEGYLHIPQGEARRLNIVNSNSTNGQYVYTCSSRDGYLKSVKLKAAGGSRAGSIWAKQFQGDGNLKLLGQWFEHIGAVEGDKVLIEWVSSTEIILQKI